MDDYPRRKICDISALPTKDTLLNKARVCTPLSAICEILDNIFDNFDENQSIAKDLEILFTVNTKGTGHD
jgi:hypothetical protein